MLQRISKLETPKRKIVVMLLSVVVAWLNTALAILVLEDYGLGLFVFTPLLLGFSVTVLYGYRQTVKPKEFYNLTIYSILIYCAGLILMAMEGLICIIMAAPLGLLIAFIGTILGQVFLKHYNKPLLPVITALTLAIPIITGFESFQKEEPAVYAVKTAVTINAAPEKVWKEVIAFPAIDEPTEWLFKAGIAYPTDAKIEGAGAGATRYCNFSTGCFVEPITIWQEPELLQFSVKETPEPLKEISPYDIEPAHLHGYFVSKKGQFKLTRLPGNKTLLEGTTWYYHKIKPAFYWKLWSNYIIHKIHNRVLEHIRKEVEHS